MRLADKKVIVTGGGRSIGRALSLAFAGEGADVAIGYTRDEAAAAATVQEIQALGRRATSIRADLAIPEARTALIAQAISFLGSIDILVNNAANITRRQLLEIPQDELERVLAVDLVAPFVLTQLVGAHLVERRQGGCILNISSISADRSSGNLAHYECAKAGLCMLTKSAALGLAPYGIRVNAILPGLTATDGNRDQWGGRRDVWEQRAAPIPLGRAGVPSDHAGAAVFLASDEASWITGASLIVDGGLSTRF
jgi:NAD(P)-dependent dehydrogenase (short-subunit alcohol dehydrogenase family)